MKARAIRLVSSERTTLISYSNDSALKAGHRVRVLFQAPLGPYVVSLPLLIQGVRACGIKDIESVKPSHFLSHQRARQGKIWRALPGHLSAVDC